jgi:DNA replication protein DnaC
MSLTQVRTLMDELCFNGMINCLEEVLHQVQEGSIGMVDALDRLLQAEKQHRSHKATQSRILRSKIRRGASLEEFDLTQGRQITKTQLRELESMRWCQEGRPLILIGPTGVGKTYLARAMGIRACEYGKQVLFLTVTEFLENQAIARGSNTYLRFRDKLTRPYIVLSPRV